MSNDVLLLMFKIRYIHIQHLYLRTGIQAVHFKYYEEIEMGTALN